MGVPNVFGSATTSIPLSQLDQNFNTGLTIGNTTVGLGNTVTTLGNVTLTNVNITSGTINSSVTEGYALANAVVYSGFTNVGTTSANLSFNGTTFTAVNDASISGLTVGKGGGSISTNTAVGYQAINATATGTNIVAVGYQTLYSNTSGVQSTAVGYQAAYNLTTASNNVAIGYGASYSNQTGDGVIAIGVNTLRTSTASYNTAVGGGNTMYANTTGTSNAAFGGNDATSSATMRFNTTGSYNSAYGFGALASNTTASNNTAVGYQAGYTNSTGTYITALGYQAGYSTTTNGITALGYQAGYTNSTGTYSTYVGWGAGYFATGGYNTCIGQASGYYITTGTKNSILGAYNGNQGGLDIRTASNRIVLSDGDGNPRGVFDNQGNFMVYAVTKETRGVTVYGTGGNGLYIKTTGTCQYWVTNDGLGTGAGTIATIYNDTSIAGSITVLSNATAYTSVSDYRLKENVTPMVGSLDKVLQLKPVTYTWKNDGVAGQGFIAHELQDVVPDCVVGEKDAVNEDGSIKAQSVDTSFLVATLTAAIQELKAEFDAYKATHP